MSFKLGDIVLWKTISEKKYKIVGDKKTAVVHQIHGELFPDEGNDFYIRENTEQFCLPFQVKANDISADN